MSTSDSAKCFYWIKPLKAVQMLYSISSSKLHHSSGQWSIFTSNFLLWNIIVIYCLSHNLLCSFTINSLPPKKHHKGPPNTNLCHASVGMASQTSVFNVHYICYKQLGRSRSPKMCYIRLVELFWHAPRKRGRPSRGLSDNATASYPDRPGTNVTSRKVGMR